MKKIALLLTLLLSVTSFSACSKIENARVDSSVTSEMNTSSILQDDSSDLSNSEAVDSSLAETTSASATNGVTTKKNSTKPSTTTTTKPTTTTTTSPSVNANGYNPLNFDVQKGVWISYLDDEIVAAGKTEEQYRKIISTAFKNIKDLGANTVYVHVRSHGDAYYNSSYFPKSKKTSTSFDQLKVMVDEAHKLGLSFHAWINPMRLASSSNGILPQNTSTDFKVRQWYDNPATNGKYIVNVNGTYILNPAYPEVRQLVYDGVREIVQNYKVDGIHIDDYFYPTTATTFDEDAFKASGAIDLGNWRRSNTSAMVSGIYNTIKNVNSKVLFGVSPQGNMSNNYNSQYIDVAKWLSSYGYLDYIVPQVYFGFKNQGLPYEKSISDWNSLVKNPNIKLVIGLAPYKVGCVDTWAGTGINEWITDPNMISRQILSAKKISKYGGVAFFSDDYILGTKANSLIVCDVENIKQALK